MVYPIIEGKKYRLDFRGYNIAKQQPTFYGTREEAIAFQKQQIESAKTFVPIRLDSSATIDEAVEAYNLQELLAARRKEITHDHQKIKASHMRHFANAPHNGKRIGDYKVKDLTAKDLKTIAQYYPDPSRQNVSKRFRTIKHFFNFCESEDVIPVNKSPAARVRVTLKGERRLAMTNNRKPEKRIKYRRITVEEMDAIIEHAEQPFKTGIITAAYTGMRPAELCALQWNDEDESYVDFDEDRIHVAWGIDTNEYGVRYRGSLKTDNADRYIPIATNVRIALREHKMNQPLKLRKENFVLPNKNGGLGYSRTYMNSGLRPACERAGVESCTWMDLRHFYASVCIYNTNLDPETIAYYMGHANGEFTQETYARWFEHAGRDRAVIEELDNAFAVRERRA